MTGKGRLRGLFFVFGRCCQFSWLTGGADVGVRGIPSSTCRDWWVGRWCWNR